MRLVLALVALGGLAALAQDPGRPLHNDCYVPDDDPAAGAMVDDARRVAVAGRAELAAERLQALLSAPANGVVALKGRLLFAAPRRWAQIRLLAEEPPFGPAVLAAWRRRYGPAADTAIHAALLAGDEREILGLLDRFPAAASAPVALLALCDRAVARGEPSRARGFLLRVPEHVARSEERRWTGSEAYIRRWQHLRDARPAAPAGWPTPGGSMARTRNGDPLPEPGSMRLLWAAPFVDEVPVPLQDPLTERSRVLPYYPVCDTRRVYLHLGGEVVAVDRLTGKLVFTVPPGAQPDILRVEAVQAESPGLHAATVSDGVLYFCRLLFDADPSDPHVLPFNELVAWNVEKGTLAWRAGGHPARHGSLLGKAVFFRGAPAVEGDRLFVYGAVRGQADDGPTRKEEAYLFCLDRRSGKLVWHRFLGFGETEAAPHFPPQSGGPPAVDAGVVVVATGLGVAAGLDTRTGEILWLFRYDRQPMLERQRLTDYEDEAKVELRPGWMREPPRVLKDSVLFAPFDADELYCCWLRGRRTPQLGFELEQYAKHRTNGHHASLLEYVAGIDRGRVYYVGRRSDRYLGAAYRAVVAHPLDNEMGPLSYGLLPPDRRAEDAARRVPPGLYGRPVIAGHVLLVPTHDALYRFDTAGPAVERPDADGVSRHEIALLEPFRPPVPALAPDEEPPARFGTLVAVDGLLFAATSSRLLCYGVR